jgi:energy-coupling factor transport system substrate-specific component
MEKLFVIGDIAGVAIVLIGAIILVLEIYGKSIFLTAPFIRSNGFKWSAAGVATVGVVAAVLIATLTIGANIVVVPGFITLNPARGLEPVIGLLFGVPGIVGGLIANPIYDIFTGKLSLGSISGAVTLGLSAYVYYRLFNNNMSLANFGKPAVWGLFLVAVLIATLIVKGIGISGWLAALHLIPENVAWYVTLPALFLSQGAAHLIIGPILTKILYPFVDRFGLTAEPMTTSAGKA